ncbi:MAG TPA: type II restriction endonuclease subunit R [Dehalococcoidia bacterium]|jgi:hypothetical protein|nr:type II restriction endonuclease subunit R [Dehalococcoidia bacterium]
MSLFNDPNIVAKVQRKLPFLFQLAEAESRRAGKVGMEVGSKREQILIALLVYRFGAENVCTNVPITTPEVDVIIFGEPLSVKTITGSGGVKVVWTVDWDSVKRFVQWYEPRSDILLAQIKWDNEGGLFFIPKAVQTTLFQELGKDCYLSVPRQGTNPRGVEISRQALRAMLRDKGAQKIPIRWERTTVAMPEPYERWLEYWQRD